MKDKNSIIVNLVTNQKHQRVSSTDNLPQSRPNRPILDSEKIAAANMAAQAAIERDKEKARMMAANGAQQHHIEQTDKSINSFYNLSISQIDILPVRSFIIRLEI